MVLWAVIEMDRLNLEDPLEYERLMWDKKGAKLTVVQMGKNDIVVQFGRMWSNCVLCGPLLSISV